MTVDSYCSWLYNSQAQIQRHYIQTCYTHMCAQTQGTDEETETQKDDLSCPKSTSSYVGALDSLAPISFCISQDQLLGGCSTLFYRQRMSPRR